MSVAIVVLLAVACGKDDKKTAGKTEAPAPEVKPVDTTPPETAPPEAARPEAKPNAVKMTDERQVMFQADTGEVTELHWMHAGKHVHFSLAHEAAKDDSVVAAISATIDGKTTEVYKCEGLDPASGGTVEMKASGSNAHVICVNPAHSQDPGSSWGAQLEWNDKNSALEKRGEWEQADSEGDPDTMDIGEDGMD